MLLTGHKSRALFDRYNIINVSRVSDEEHVVGSATLGGITGA